jgi:hypothetical protein
MWSRPFQQAEIREGHSFAPSWSWASAQSISSLGHLSDEVQYSLVIRGYTCQPVHDDLFGRLSRAELVVETSLVPLAHRILQRHNARHKLEIDVPAEVAIHPDYQYDDRTVFDENKIQLVRPNETGPLFCMEVAGSLGKEDPSVSGLVLVHNVSADANVYERIGTFTADEWSMHAFGYQCTAGMNASGYPCAWTMHMSGDRCSGRAHTFGRPCHGGKWSKTERRTEIIVLV